MRARDALRGAAPGACTFGVRRHWLPRPACAASGGDSERTVPMARGVGEQPERSPSAILSEVEYPISRDDLAFAAAEAGAPVDAINFLRSLPDRIYTSPTDVPPE